MPKILALEIVLSKFSLKQVLKSSQASATRSAYVPVCPCSENSWAAWKFWRTSVPTLVDVAVQNDAKKAVLTARARECIEGAFVCMLVLPPRTDVNLV
jgi:hypothetical protein